jgi:hypothetical protein
MVKPASETIPVPAAAKTTKGTHECRLQRIIGVFSRSEHSYRITDARVLMAPDQTGERFNVSGKDRGNELGIRLSLHK